MSQCLDAQLWEWKRLVEESEKALVLGHYDTAESMSHEILQKNITDDSVKERAAIVFVQSVFETMQFSKARGVLCSSFSSLEKVPANVILLWISLALETDDRRQADSLILALLKSKGSQKSGWKREQYVTLVHMYATDILLPTLKDPSEVHLWFRRQTFIPLDPREKQFLEDEVSAKVLQGSLESMVPIISPMGSIRSNNDKQSLFVTPRTSNSFDRDRPYDLGIDLAPVELEFSPSGGRKLQRAGDVTGDFVVSTTQQQRQDIEHLDFLGSVQRLLFHAIGMKIGSQSSTTVSSENKRQQQLAAAIVPILAFGLFAVVAVKAFYPGNVSAFWERLLRLDRIMALDQGYAMSARGHAFHCLVCRMKHTEATNPSSSSNNNNNNRPSGGVEWVLCRILDTFLVSRALEEEEEDNTAVVGAVCVDTNMTYIPVQRFTWPAFFNGNIYSLAPRKKMAYISNLAVATSVRRAGIGSSLVLAAEKIAAEEWNVTCCTLHVDPTNTAAYELYTRLGYRYVSRQDPLTAFLEGRRQDTRLVLLYKKLHHHNT